MKVFTTIPNYPSENKSIVTIGTFDGVHLGHRVVLRRMREIANKTKGESVLLTFSPHPRHVLYKDNQDMKLITTLQEKQDLLKSHQYFARSRSTRHTLSKTVQFEQF